MDLKYFGLNAKCITVNENKIEIFCIQIKQFIVIDD